MIHRIAEYLPLPATLMTSMRQEESGGVEVTDEIMRILRENRRDAAPATNGAPETVTLPADAAREPGEEG